MGQQGLSGRCVSTLALSLMLTACGGGGGVNSTPTPIPTPTPTPAPTPTPTPTPTPGANADLLAPLASESFANVAGRATATFDSEGRTQGTARPSTGTIRYDAAEQAYTLSTAGGSITFRPADIDQAISNAGAVAYVRRQGDSTDTLTLTRPGTSGVLTYRYVGGAFWQHSVIGQTSGHGSLDAFIYGVPTAGSAMPKTGIGTYVLDLIGAETGANFISPLSGEGLASIDFTSGTVVISGTMNLAMLGGQTGPFQGRGTMGSGADFSGTFSFDDFGPFSGALNGKLFGPGSEEIGAIFSTEEADGRVAIGALLGRADDRPANISFNADGSLDNSQLFSTTEAKLTFTTPLGIENNDAANAFAHQATATGGFLVQYNAASETYSLTAPDRSVAFDHEGRAILPPSAGDERLNGIDGDGYVGSGSWLSGQSGPNGNPPFSYRLSYFVFGMPTAAADMVRTGRAGYALRFSGDAVDGNYKNLMGIFGTGNLITDFASGDLTIAGDLLFSEYYDFSGRQRETATGSLSGSGKIASGTNRFSGSLNFDGIGDYTGTFSGQFYGPAAQQLGGIFTASNGANRAAGAFTGKQDSSILDAEQTLAGLTSVTTLGAFAVNGTYGGIEEQSIVYDPASGTYTLSLFDPYGSNAPIPFEISRQDIIAGNSDASRTWYERAGDRAVSGYLFNPGAANPTLALTYTSFADLVGTTDSAGPQHYYLVYGIQTPASLLPRSGVASYSGIARGTAETRPGGYSGPVSGTSRLMADFAEGTATLSLQLRADNPERSPIGDFAMEGFIANNGFYGGSGGVFRGNFFGPKADEFGAIWTVEKPVEGGGMQIIGAAVGKRD